VSWLLSSQRYRRRYKKKMFGLSFVRPDSRRHVLSLRTNPRQVVKDRNANIYPFPLGRVESIRPERIRKSSSSPPRGVIGTS
jgi:hypothetical protein